MAEESGNFLLPDWHKTPDGKVLFSSIQKKNSLKRKAFTLLEKPIVPSPWNPGLFPYKIFISGRSGVGKTSTLANLAATPVPQSHLETPGIQVSTVYWPAFLISNQLPIMFKLTFWDVGENALKKFNHALPACKDHMDAVLYIFSFTDKGSFDDLPQQMSRVIDGEDMTITQFVLGTKTDLYSEGEVTQQNIVDFESQWKIPVHTIQNKPTSPDHEPSEREFNQTAAIINHMCNELFRRDQKLLDRHYSTRGNEEGR